MKCFFTHNRSVLFIQFGFVSVYYKPKVIIIYKINIKGFIILYKDLICINSPTTYPYWTILAEADEQKLDE